MREILKATLVLAVTLTLTQACASGGAMEAAPSAPVATGAAAPSYGIYGVDNYFKVEWQADHVRGMTVVNGYVTNQWGMTVKNVRLRVEALDASGATTASYIGYVNAFINSGSRVYFEVFVRDGAPSFRVTVLSFDPVQGHG